MREVERLPSGIAIPRHLELSLVLSQSLWKATFNLIKCAKSVVKPYPGVSGGERLGHFGGPFWATPFPLARDRKSTRLNSSHGYISYAGFCLKKKNKEPFAAYSSSLRRVYVKHNDLSVRRLSHNTVRAA